MGIIIQKRKLKKKKMSFRILCFSNCVKQIITKNLVNTVTVTRCLATKVDSKNIGFIGLGNMGGHMAYNLIKKVGNLYGFLFAFFLSSNSF